MDNMKLIAKNNKNGKPGFQDPDGMNYILSISKGYFLGLDNNLIIPVNSIDVQG